MTTAEQWLQGARPKTLYAAIAPVLVGTAFAGYNASLLHFLLALSVSLSLQIGVNYANDYYEKYDKSKYQKTMNSHSDVDQNVREKQERRVVISDNKKEYDVSEKDDDDYYYTPKTKSKPMSERIEYKKPIIDIDESSNNSFAFIDLFLYIISGIILIFVMEQFVKIGILLQV